MSNIGVLNVYQYNWGHINKKILQRDDIFTSWSNNFDTEMIKIVFVASETPFKYCII